jgi:hypothetical protein
MTCVTPLTCVTLGHTALGHWVTLGHNVTLLCSDKKLKKIKNMPIREGTRCDTPRHFCDT